MNWSRPCFEASGHAASDAHAGAILRGTMNIIPLLSIAPLSVRRDESAHLEVIQGTQFVCGISKWLISRHTPADPHDPNEGHGFHRPCFDRPPVEADGSGQAAGSCDARRIARRRNLMAFLRVLRALVPASSELGRFARIA